MLNRLLDNLADRIAERVAARFQRHIVTTRINGHDLSNSIARAVRDIETAGDRVRRRP